MRLMTLVLVLLSAGVACAEAEPAAPRTQLTITFWPQGRAEGNARRSTLRCVPTGGTLPGAARACARLAGLENPFQPVPDDVVCTQVFGGPQEALVAGVHEGRRVWARFNRRDGCQIDRWNRVRFLFA